MNVSGWGRPGEYEWPLLALEPEDFPHSALRQTASGRLVYCPLARGGGDDPAPVRRPGWPDGIAGRKG